ncbi:MAG: dihydroorotate dehydrogenase [Candidatus Bathyarchaeia archaeon]
MPSLTVKIASLQLRNPVMSAAGILGITAQSLLKLANVGAGAVVTKSISLKPSSGYPNPTITQVNCGFINAMGLPNPGIEAFREEIQLYKTLTNVPLIVSVYGFTPEEYAQVAAIAAENGADAVELNVSCPHAEKTGAEIGQDPKKLAEVVKEVKEKVSKPVFVKLTPNVTTIAEIAKAAENAGADAVTAINTVKAMAIDPETTFPILANKMGGLSGPAIKPIAIRCVYEIYREVRIPIIGCGGIATWHDAVEFMLAGASAVQIGTAIASKGLHVFQSVTKGIEAYMKRKGFKSVKEIVGLSHSH